MVWYIFRYLLKRGNAQFSKRSPNSSTCPLFPTATWKIPTGKGSLIGMHLSFISPSMILLLISAAHAYKERAPKPTPRGVPLGTHLQETLINTQIQLFLTTLNNGQSFLWAWCTIWSIHYNKTIKANIFQADGPFYRHKCPAPLSILSRSLSVHLWLLFIPLVFICIYFVSLTNHLLSPSWPFHSLYISVAFYPFVFPVS